MWLPNCPIYRMLTFYYILGVFVYVGGGLEIRGSHITTALKMSCTQGVVVGLKKRRDFCFGVALKSVMIIIILLGRGGGGAVECCGMN